MKVGGGSFYCVWRWGESNPRAYAVIYQFYMCSMVCVIRSDLTIIQNDQLPSLRWLGVVVRQILRPIPMNVAAVGISEVY